MEQHSELVLEHAEEAFSFLWTLFVHLFPRTLAYGAAAFALSLVIVVFLFRKSILVRRPRYWNIVSKLHYVIIPVVFALAGCALGAVHSAQKTVVAQVDSYLPDAVMKALPTLEHYLTERLPVSSPDEPTTVAQAVQRFMQSLYYRPASDGVFDRAKARCINWITLNFGKRVVTATFTAIVTYAVGRAGETLGLDPNTIEFTANTIKKMDLSQVDKNIAQITLDAVQTQVRGVFKSLYLAVVPWFLVVLLPVIDTLVYRQWWCPRRAQAAPS